MNLNQCSDERSLSHVRGLVDDELRGCHVDGALMGATDLTHVPFEKIARLCSALVNTGLIVLHGSHFGPCEHLEPRQANDAAKQSGNRLALYATTNVGAALMHAVINKPYLVSTLLSYTLGYAFFDGKIRFRASENLYRLFQEQVPHLYVDGYIYVLAKERFEKASDTLTEYHSRDNHQPILVLKVPRQLGDDLFIAGRGADKDTVLEYSFEESVAIDTHTARLNTSAPSSCHNLPLDTYEPSVQWYLHAPSNIHGLGHAARVLVWADVLGRWMIERGEVLDLDVVRWAAVLHDIRRMDDGRDLPHGERAGQWIQENRQKIHFPLTEFQLDSVTYCCKWHVSPDRQAPTLTPELICLKDADALDRVRVGDIAFLRTQRARALGMPGQILYHWSEVDKTPNRWEAAKNAARQLDLWT